MPDITLEQFEAEAKRLPRRQRIAEGGREEVRLGRGLRQGHAVRREGSQRASGRAREGAGWRQPRSSTPASAGSPARRRTAAVSSRAPTSRAWNVARGQVRRPEPGLLRHRPRDGGADDPRPRAPTRRRTHYLKACVAATSSPASCSASRAPDPTSPACRPAPSATATSGSSTARRCGRQARSTATSARSSAAPIPTCPSTRASPASSST